MNISGQPIWGESSAQERFGHRDRSLAEVIFENDRAAVEDGDCGLETSRPASCTVVPVADS